MSDSLPTPQKPTIPTPDAPEETPPPPTVAAFHAARFREQVERLTDALDRLAADPLDEEAVHDARVSCRRLRVGLRLVRDGLGRRKRVRRLGERLSGLRTALGAAREAEVARVTLTEFRPRLAGDERLAADAFAAFLDVRHHELRRAAAEQLGTLDVAGLRRGLRRCVARLERRAMAAPETAGGGEPVISLVPAHVPPLGPRAVAAVERRRAACLALPLEPLLEGVDPALHRCRIEAKKLRYALEFYEPVFGVAARARLKLLKEMQDRLGAVHDRADLGARLHDLARAARRLEDGRLVIGYEALARLVEEDRRALLVGFSRQHNGVAHPGFVPGPRAEFMAVARVDDVEGAAPDEPVRTTAPANLVAGDRPRADGPNEGDAADPAEAAPGRSGHGEGA